MVQVNLLLFTSSLLAVSQGWWLWGGDDSTADTAATEPPVIVDAEPPLVNSDEGQRTLTNQSAADDVDQRHRDDETTTAMPAASIDGEESDRFLEVERMQAKMEEVIAAHETVLHTVGEKHVDDQGEHNPEYDHQVCGKKHQRSSTLV
jgi:hypothetical protein